MLAHIINAGIRALAASIVIGGVLIYAAGGFNSPNVRPLGGVIIVGFFVFWVVFVFMFGKRVPKYDRQRRDRDLDEGTPLAFRGARRREFDDDGHSGEGAGGGGGGGGGGDGGGGD
jgi:uncharacterized membrane protein YfcA